MAGFLVRTWLIYVAGGSYAFEISMPALSLIFAAAMGPMVAITTMGLRELRHLPLTDRDLWRTTWILATIVTSGGLLATKAISTLLVAAFGGTPKLSAATILLSAVYDFGWAGAVLLVLPLLGYAGNVGARRGTLAVSLTVAGRWPPACLLRTADSGWRRVADRHRRVHTGDEGRADRRPGDRLRRAGVDTAARACWPANTRPNRPRRCRQSRPAALDDRLTGISRVLVPHVLATLTLPVGACLALAAYGVVSGPGPWWFVPPAPTVFDPEDTGYRGLTYFVLLPCSWSWPCKASGRRGHVC